MRKRDVIIFFAGVEAFHSITHLFLWATGQTLVIPLLVITPQWSMGSGIVNALITIGLLYWASKVK